MEMAGEVVAPPAPEHPASPVEPVSTAEPPVEQPVQPEQETHLASSAEQETPHPLPVFCFYLAELSHYQVSSELYSPFRARLCHALMESFGLQTLSQAEILATRTDLGQFHADNYLGLLQIASDLWALEADEKTRKKTKLEDNLVKERLAVFNLDLPAESRNSVFDGMFAYHRLCVTGSLASAQMIVSGKCNFAINWFGGHTRARRARAVGGCFVNDSVLTCLGLISSLKRILHISMDFCHCDGVEEAFYTTDRVATLSFHSSTFPTGKEDDCGYGNGEGYAVNVPIDPECFNDDMFVPLFANIVKHCVDAFNPMAVVFVASPSVMAGNRNSELNLSLKGYLDCLDVVKSMERPMIILGGAGSSSSVAAIAWCAATSRLLGKDILGESIPESCTMLDHFALNKYKMDVPPRSVRAGLETSKLKALEARLIQRLKKTMTENVE